MSSVGGLSLLQRGTRPDLPWLDGSLGRRTARLSPWSFRTYHQVLRFNRGSKGLLHTRKSIRCSSHEITLEVRKLSKRNANGEPVLDGVSLSVQTGRIHALVGPSGSGKTTVLRALNRLWEPPAGAVFYEGVDVTTMDVISLRLRVGMVFQSTALFEGTVADNVRYGPKLRGIHLSTERVERLLLQAGFAEPSTRFLERSSQELSGGEAQRVALARTLANKPSVLLMDEPTSSLDPISTRSVETAVMGLVNDLGMTVVLVSHDLDQVSRVADLATMLDKGGKVLETGSPADLSRSDNRLLNKFFAGEQH